MNPLGTPAYLPGIDVSHFQGVINWEHVKAAGIGFAFIKGTDGLGSVDPRAAFNARECTAFGIPFGLYHFFRPSLDAEKQAEFFLAQTKGFGATLPPALDLELGPVTATQACGWLDTVDASLGREPLVYVSPAFAAESFDATDEPLIGVYPLWIAEYTTRLGARARYPSPWHECTTQPAPTVPACWSDWEFWQHTPQGQVDAMPTVVDLDWFHGTAEDLAAVWIK